ncbi:MAG: hypothetical protein WCW53_06365 [Syntrophales bacterium]
MLDQTPEKMAEKILGFDEASLTSLWEKYKRKMEHFEVSREWERAVIVFFIINAVRAKNHIFNEQIQKMHDAPPQGVRPPKRGKPSLTLVKPDSEKDGA